ncbi:thioredoxin domain-containing protein [Halalkalibacillus halophilus]|uniref:thioredoxin domain-containing protein n=1 Tax=Halalkalibacillus halophilus TaxID=392827 RepID=UPI00040D220A|nr:thioredoxin domain-containing protein [Halalkalibacillus halophilus]
MNRLQNEKSPYLLQHKENPVDWFPWGQEAFDRAKAENKPIFLSIGYSTCHWCHVMAHESFEDPEVAELINTDYIAIKVDREERPDIDSIYMKLAQQMAGHGGWPLSIFMTPEQIPFYAGTYFPPTSKHGMPGIKDVLIQLAETYQTKPGQVEEVTNNIKDALSRTVMQKGNEQLSNEHVELAFQNLVNDFDSTYGGFGEAPKFPTPHHIYFLLKYHHMKEDQLALNIAETTLQKMGKSGLYDHIGGGFTRYATDQAFEVPHFEKMLYDNGLLLVAYSEAYQITGNEFYLKICEEVIEFLTSEMRSDSGTFYAAIDADSEGVEGKYYTWSYHEIFEVLEEDLAHLFVHAYQITPEGNFQGENIPQTSLADFATIQTKFQLEETQLNKKLNEAKAILYQTRQQRTYPHVDDKILTSWNAMVIVGLSKASQALSNPSYFRLAIQAIEDLENKLIVNSRVMARYRDGDVKHKGFLDDYAYLAWAYLELYEASYDLTYLNKAKQMVNAMIDLFWDEDHGGFFFYGNDAEALIKRDKELHDGATPSGNSVASYVLTKLYAFTAEPGYGKCLEELHSTFYKLLSKYPHGSTFFMQSVLLETHATKEVVLLGDQNQLPLHDLQKTFLPNVSILVAESADELKQLAPFTKEFNQKNSQPTIFVCENFTCNMPSTDVYNEVSNIIS